MSSSNLEFVDIGANLLDPMFSGTYRSKERHESDFDLILQRSWDNNVKKIVITAGTLEESKKALELSMHDDRLYSTVGVHPTRCNEIENDGNVIQELIKVCHEGIKTGKVKALGELGLDYDRVEFCPIEVQKRGFLAQLNIAEETKLPLFLHNRNTGTDLLDLLKSNRHRFTKGVVHSFDDTLDLALSFIELDLYIGINGCSLKKEDNLKVLKDIPLDKILLETDCPWCDIRQSHASYQYVQTKFETKNEKKFERGCCVKSRSEPCHIIQVAEVVAGVKGLDLSEVVNVCFKNSCDFFGF